MAVRLFSMQGKITLMVIFGRKKLGKGFYDGYDGLAVSA